MLRDQQNTLRAVILTGLFAALIYIGIWTLRIPIPAMVGRPFIHFGNTLTVTAILFWENAMVCWPVSLAWAALIS